MKYRSIFASQDLKDKMEEYFDHTSLSHEQRVSAFGIEVHVLKALPLDSALFVNHIGEIVGIYSDGKLVEVTPRFCNKLPRSMSACSKKKASVGSE